MYGSFYGKNVFIHLHTIRKITLIIFGLVERQKKHTIFIKVSGPSTSIHTQLCYDLKARHFNEASIESNQEILI